MKFGSLTESTEYQLSKAHLWKGLQRAGPSETVTQQYRSSYVKGCQSMDLRMFFLSKNKILMNTEEAFSYLACFSQENICPSNS